MKPIRVNVDFEEILMGKPANPRLRSGIEFLSLWVQNRPLLATRSYSAEYLTHIKFHTGLEAKVVLSGEAEDWWGDLTSIDEMRRLSSKTEFLKWWKSRWPLEANVCSSWEELNLAVGEGQWLIKKSDGMSGRGHIKLTREELPQLRARLEEALRNSIVVEPLFDRTRDVSALWLPEEKRFIYYRNEIDHRFQWRGSLISAADMEIAPEETGSWTEDLKDLQIYVAGLGHQGPFSVDAFYYLKDGKEMFHPGSEMNPRKTMGWITYQLWKNNRAAFAGLCLLPLVLKEDLWREVANQEHALLLSPENSPFAWYWIEADGPEEWQAKREEFLKELPEAQARGRV